MDPPAKQLVRQTLTRIGELAAHPAAFGILLVYASLWFVFDRASLDWHAFATLATWFMTLIIQRAEDRLQIAFVEMGAPVHAGEL